MTFDPMDMARRGFVVTGSTVRLNTDFALAPVPDDVAAAVLAGGGASPALIAWENRAHHIAQTQWEKGADDFTFPGLGDG